MNSKFNFCDLFLLIWLIFSLAMKVIPQGTSHIISILFYLAIGSLFLMYVYSFASCYFTRTLKVLTFFIFLLLGYGIGIWVSGDNILVQESGVYANGRAYVQTIMFSLFPIYAGYAFAEKEKISSHKLAIWTLLFLAINIVLFFFQRSQVLLTALTDDVTNNAGYLIAAFIPILTLYHRRVVLQSILLVLCTFLVIFGMKRGAILICGVCLLFIIWHNLKNNTTQKFLVALMSAILILGVYYFFNQLLQTNEYFASRIMLMIEGDAQARDIITEQIINYLKDQTAVFKWVFGSGAYATIRNFYNFAHNDWLEIIVCQGLLGIILYFSFYCSLFKDCIQEKDIELKQALTLIFIFLFLRTFFSMSYGDIPFFLSFFIGYCLSKVHKNQSLIDE